MRLVVTILKLANLIHDLFIHYNLLKRQKNSFICIHPRYTTILHSQSGEDGVLKYTHNKIFFNIYTNVYFLLFLIKIYIKNIVHDLKWEWRNPITKIKIQQNILKQKIKYADLDCPLHTNIPYRQVSTCVDGHLWGHVQISALARIKVMALLCSV